MKLLSRITKVSRRALGIGLVSAAFVAAGLFAGAQATAITGGDCDDNAVIRCGVGSAADAQAAYNNNASVRKIFSCMSISQSEVVNLRNTTVKGYVTKSGNVYANGKLVATGALTGGRQSMPGSTDRTQACGTAFFQRPPSVSFQQDQLSALVSLDSSGAFQFAIINSCGNPVIAKAVAQPKPSYTINKEVRTTSENTYHKNVTVQPGTHVMYRITVNSTGDAAVTNLKVSDNLPAHVSYVGGSLKRDGASAAANAFFNGGGVNVASLAAGHSTVFTFEAIVGVNDTASKCSNEQLTNTGKMVATNLPAKSSQATVSKQCVPAPLCTNFNITAGDNRTVRVSQFTFKANGASFVNAAIAWGDTKSATVTNATQVVGQTHQYAADGTYTVGVTITFSQNGKHVTAGGAQCQKRVVFKTGTPPVVTTPPAAPTELTNTGPGSAIGLFAAVSFVGAIAHRMYLARRLS